MTTITSQRPALLADTDNAAVAALILRVSLGGLFLAHAWLKIFVFTPAGTAGYFESIGFPGALAYLVMFGEAAGGIALIFGLYTRVVSLALIPILLGTIYAAHGSAGFFFSNQGGGWEYPAFWSVALVVQSLLGNGALSLAKAQG